MHATRVFVAAILLIGTSVPSLADWRQEISPYDRDRLAHFADSRASGLEEVDSGASQADRNVIHGVLDPGVRPISAQELTGTWRCRLMKLGGLAPAIVYTWHTCRFRDTPNGLFFEKVTGTQRFSGYADPEGQHFILLAGMSVRDEEQHPYSGSGRGFGANATPNDYVGVVSAIGSNHARIEFPYPVIESVFDVIELQR